LELGAATGGPGGARRNREDDVNAERKFGLLDHFALWASVGASLYIMPFGALLVPALSIEQAVLATMLAGFLGGLLIASVAALAAASGHSSAELLTAPFGGSAQRPIAVLLMVRHLLFATFALALIADSAELISERSLGDGLRPLWVAVFGIAGLGLALAGPVRVSTGMRRAGLWLILLVAVAITASAYAEFEVPSYLRRPAVGGWPSFWQATDIMMIFPLLWLPVVADFARLGRDNQAAARGSFAGVFGASIWFGVLGVLYLPATDSGDVPGFLVGMQLGLGALALLLLLQIDEVFVNSHATTTTIESLGVGAWGRFAPAALLAAAAPAALLWHVADLEGYVLLLAAVFVPAFAVVLAHAFRAGRVTPAIPAIAWVSGFVLYQWITPAEVGWWRTAFSEPFEALGLPFALSEDVEWLGAAIPSFVAAFCIDLALRGMTTAVSTRPRVTEATG
jgi:purine-cytosine permease-like protein